jgi:hypothetical protein
VTSYLELTELGLVKALSAAGWTWYPPTQMWYRGDPQGRCKIADESLRELLTVHRWALPTVVEKLESLVEFRIDVDTSNDGAAVELVIEEEHGAAPRPDVDRDAAQKLVDHLREHAGRIAGGGPGDENYDPETLDVEHGAADMISGLLGEKMCERCRKRPASAPHVCPYKAELHNNLESLCTCCDACQHECAMDV